MINKIAMLYKYIAHRQTPSKMCLSESQHCTYVNPLNVHTEKILEGIHCNQKPYNTIKDIQEVMISIERAYKQLSNKYSNAHTHNN